MTMNGYVLIIIDEAECNEKRYEKKGLYLGANVFSTKVLIGDAIFTSPTGDGTASFRVHPSHAKVQSFAGQRSTFITQSFLRRWVFGSRDLPLCSQALYWLIWANPAVVWYEELHCPRPQQCMKWCLYILAYIPHNAVVTPCVCLFDCFCLFLLCFWGTTSAILSSHNVCNLRSHLLACQQALNLECASKASHPVLHCINSWAAAQCIPFTINFSVIDINHIDISKHLTNFMNSSHLWVNDN